MASIETYTQKDGSKSYRIKYYLNGRQAKTPLLKLSLNEIILIKEDIENRLARHKAGIKDFVDPFNRAGPIPENIKSETVKITVMFCFILKQFSSGILSLSCIEPS